MTQHSANLGMPLFEAARAMGVPFKEEALPTDRWVEANGLRFHCLDWGTPGLPLVVLVHGVYQTAHSWDFTALALRDRFHVLALEPRGHGDSDWAPDGDYSVHAMKEDMEAVVPALGLGKVTLVGLSLGGRMSMLYAAHHPEDVRALVVVDTGPELEQRGRRKITKFVGGEREAPFEDFLARAHRFNPRRPIEQLRGSLSHNLRQLPNGNWTWKYDVRLRDRFARGPEDEAAIADAVGRLSFPTLIVRGSESDILAADAAQRFHESVPGSRLVTVQGAGHLVPGDRPVQFIQEVRSFLEGLTV